MPEGSGGLGLTPQLQRHAGQRLLAAGAPQAGFRNVIGYGMVRADHQRPRHPEQKERYLRPLFTGEEVWCQLFSEPGAGLRRGRACPRGRVRDGDEWVRERPEGLDDPRPPVELRPAASRRTDPDVPKHKGMTCFLVDMHAPGVDVRPLYQITGEAEFNEIFFTDVHRSPTPSAWAASARGGAWRSPRS